MYFSSGKAVCIKGPVCLKIQSKTLGLMSLLTLQLFLKSATQCIFVGFHGSEKSSGVPVAYKEFWGLGA